jgi:hypothetical protein
MIGVEQEREQRLIELTDDLGTDWPLQYCPGSFGCHELLDRTALAADFVETSVLSHPACIQNPAWFALVEQAVSALRDLYQAIGAVHLAPPVDGDDG